MAREFNTTIWLCQNCPLQEGDARTWFYNADDYDEKIEEILTNNNIPLFGEIQKIENYARMPTESGVIHRVSIGISPEQGNAENHMSYNYMIFQNNSYVETGDTPKRFFAFIRNTKYVNENTVEYTYVIDDLQTYQKDMTITSAYVQREHAEVDTMFGNLTAEPDLPSSGSYTSPCIANDNLFGDGDNQKEAYMVLMERSAMITISTLLHNAHNISSSFDIDGIYFYAYATFLASGDVNTVRPHNSIQGYPCNYGIIFITNQPSSNGNAIANFLEKAQEYTTAIYDIIVLPTGSYRVVEENLQNSTSHFVSSLQAPFSMLKRTINTSRRGVLDTGPQILQYESKIPYATQKIYPNVAQSGVINLKCLTYPYTKCTMVIDGQEIDMKPEKLFKWNGSNALYQLEKRIQLYPSPSSVITPLNYYSGEIPPDKSEVGYYNISQMTGQETTETIPFTVDSYSEYAYTNKAANATLKSSKETSAALSFASSLVSSVGSGAQNVTQSAVQMAQGKVVSGATGLATAGIGTATSAITAGLNYHDSLQSLKAQFKAEEQRARDSVDRYHAGQTQGKLNVEWRYTDRLQITTYDITQLKIIDTYFSLFGYSVNTTKNNPKYAATRPFFNFFKATQLMIRGKIPPKAIEQIKLRISDGVLFVNAFNSTSKTAVLYVFDNPLEYASQNTIYDNE